MNELCFTEKILDNMVIGTFLSFYGRRYQIQFQSTRYLYNFNESLNVHTMPLLSLLLELLECKNKEHKPPGVNEYNNSTRKTATTKKFIGKR